MADDTLKLFESARKIPMSRAKAAAYEEVVRRCDAVNRFGLAFDTRLNLFWTYSQLGFPDKAIVAVSWCLAHVEKHGCDVERRWDRFLSVFKHGVLNLIDFPAISLEKVDDMVDRMEAYFSRSDRGMKPVHFVRHKLAMRTGRLDEAAEYRERFLHLPTNDVDTTIEWEQATDVEYFATIENFDRAYEIGLPLLRAMDCNAARWVALNMFRPLCLMGKQEEAAMYQRQHAQHYRNRMLANQLASNIAVLVHFNEPAKAVRLVERHFEESWNSTDVDSHFRIAASMHALMSRLAQFKRNRKLALPPNYPLYVAEGTYDTQIQTEFWKEKIKAIAAEFDTRNGNRYFSVNMCDRFNY